ncbi:hypothetical protein MELA_02522 [Candidatus Methylomirabilis lanthanidiphila]|uniref:Uncharacterized protein n=1 Tax=Candidatus Methylomirabilis lanthanidiphila TaxID=2211376 RepID=A0A564ZM02_9BACT|nr:hypothetical protein MELA_02522 [Candidatus Methylomirabilis lanthanidiphila]
MLKGSVERQVERLKAEDYKLWSSLSGFSLQSKLLTEMS